MADQADPLLQTLPGRLLYFARTRPDRVALREKDLGAWQQVTWREYADNVAAIALVLRDWGIGPGDHVAILSENRREWIYTDLAAQGIGARSVGIYQTNPPEDVAYILNHSGARILLCEDQEQVDKAIEIADQTPDVTQVIVVDDRGMRHYSDSRIHRWDDVMAAGRERLGDGRAWFDQTVADLDPTQPAMIVYTSGTTGPPKGAMLSSANVLSGSDATANLFELDDSDTVLSYLPLCHVAEKIFSLFLPLTTGAVVHFGESIATIQEDLREVSPTVFLGVPRIWEKMQAMAEVKMNDSSWLKRTLYRYWTNKGRQIARRRLDGNRTLLDQVQWWIGDVLVFRPLQERFGLRRCKLAISGAAPISADLLLWYHGIGVEILEGYGMTESGGVSHINRPGHARLGTVGQVMPFVEYQLASDGELLLRGPNVFCGYLNNDQATRETIDQDGWLHTGDVATVMDDGTMAITGRKKEIIITSGGKNLSPEKIENALKTSPYVKEAVAIGDRRKFIAALVQVEYDTTGDWATRSGIPYTSFEDLSAKAEVIELIGKEIKKANDLLAQVEQVKAFKLFPKELHQDDGELTATQKVRRRNIHDLYQDMINGIYK